MAGGPPDPAAIEAALAAARTFNITLWTLYAFGVLVTFLRFVARVKAVGWKRLELDDYLAGIALLLYTIQVNLGYQIGNLARGMANNGMTPEQREALSPDDPEFTMRVNGSKIQVAGWSVYSTLMLFLKFSMLFFFLRLTNGLSRKQRMSVHLGFVLVLLGYLASIGAIFFSCMPIHKYWQINPDPGNLCQAAVSHTIVWSSFAANLTSDLYLIIIPLPLLWGSRLRLIEKLASTLILCAGIFVLVCATLKTIFVIYDPVNGAELAGAWGTREAFVAVVTTNLPMIFPLFKSWLRPILPSSRRNDSKYKTPTGFQTIGGGGGGGSRGLNGSKNTKGSNVLTNTTFTESEERIINEMKAQNMRDAAVQAQANGRGGEHKDPERAIVVLTEFDMSEDKSTHNTGEHSQKATRTYEPW